MKLETPRQITAFNKGLRSARRKKNKLAKISKGVNSKL